MLFGRSFGKGMALLLFPWIVCGDCNAIFALKDKISGAPNIDDIRSTNAFLHDFDLMEPPSTGKRFTWTDGQIHPSWVKLDRFHGKLHLSVPLY